MIALYVHEIAATGVVRNILALTRHFAARGERVQLITALSAEGEALPEGVEHVALLGKRGARGLEQIRAAPALHRELRRSRPDILISGGNHGHATVWAATRGITHTRRIYRISNDTVRGTGGAPRARIRVRLVRHLTTALVARDADHAVLVSPTLLAETRWRRLLDAGRASIIRNGVDVSAAQEAAAAPCPHPWLECIEPVILAIGRLNVQKNLPTLIEAMARLQARVPARLIILGESRDDSRATLIAQADRLGIADRVLLPGRTGNVFAWLARASAFALPSWWEGSPNVLLEAIAVDVPVVASHSAGNAAEILDEGRYGLLVDPGDPQAMADALDAQLDPGTVIRPGMRAAAFDLGVTLERWDALLQRMRGAAEARAPERLPTPSSSRT